MHHLDGLALDVEPARLIIFRRSATPKDHRHLLVDQPREEQLREALLRFTGQSDFPRIEIVRAMDFDYIVTAGL